MMSLRAAEHVVVEAGLHAGAGSGVGLHPPEPRASIDRVLHLGDLGTVYGERDGATDAAKLEVIHSCAALDGGRGLAGDDDGRRSVYASAVDVEAAAVGVHVCDVARGVGFALPSAGEVHAAGRIVDGLPD